MLKSKARHAGLSESFSRLLNSLMLKLWENKRDNSSSFSRLLNSLMLKLYILKGRAETGFSRLLNSLMLKFVNIAIKRRAVLVAC